MRLKNLLTAAVMSVAALAVAPAHAIFITGSVSISDGFVAGTTGTTTNIVGALTSVSLNPVAIIQPNSCSRDFSTNNGPSGSPCLAPSTFSTGVFNVSPFSAGSLALYGPLPFTFTATSTLQYTPSSLTCVATLCRDTLDFVLGGNWNAAGFQSTSGIFIFSAQGACTRTNLNVVACSDNVTTNWSGSLVALGTNTTTPEPGSIALLGLGLGLAGWMSRRRKA